MKIPTIRTLFITKMSYPPVGGVGMRNWQNINMMMKFGPVGVFSVFDQDSQNETINGVTLWHHYNVNAHPSIRKNFGRWLWWLSRIGLNDYWGYLKPAAQQLDAVIKKFQPDLVIFEELWLYHYISVVKNYQCRLIFDEHNVEAYLYDVIKCSDRSLRCWARKKLHIPQIKFTENNLIRQANQVWVCSDQDRELLENLYGAIPHSHSIPNGIDLKYYESVRFGKCAYPSGLEKTGFNVLFPGHFGYIPNSDAAQLLLEEIYPQLKKVYPHCRLLLVGRGATSFMEQAAQKDSNIIVTGEVPDMRPYLAAASVMVVPLTKGGGTRFKILEAFAAGCPVVSTTKGAEGLNAQDEEHLLIGDDVQAIAERVIQLWSNVSLGEKLANNAYQLVKSAYSWQAVSQKVELAIQQLFS